MPSPAPWRRPIALVVDFSLVLAVSVASWVDLLIQSQGGVDTTMNGPLADRFMAWTGLITLLLLLTMLVRWVTTAWTGASPGKRLLRIQVVQAGSTRIGWWRAAAREGTAVLVCVMLGLMIPPWGFMAGIALCLLMPLLPAGRAPQDYLTRTQVIARPSAE